MRPAATPPKAPGIADLIGHTPLLRLERLADHVAPAVRLFAKAEWHNPGGSVKDRAALWMWRAHFESTGPEIWDQTRGTMTHLVACLGTTGTFVGAGRYLKKMAPRVRLVGVQPDSPFHGLEGVKHLETSTVPGIWDPDLADEMMSVATEDAQVAARRLAREEGLLVGTSSGAAFDAALRLAERIREGVVVAVFPDSGQYYMSERYWEQAP